MVELPLKYRPPYYCTIGSDVSDVLSLKFVFCPRNAFNPLTESVYSEIKVVKPVYRSIKRSPVVLSSHVYASVFVV